MYDETIYESNQTNTNETNTKKNIQTKTLKSNLKRLLKQNHSNMSFSTKNLPLVMKKLKGILSALPIDKVQQVITICNDRIMKETTIDLCDEARPSESNHEHKKRKREHKKRKREASEGSSKRQKTIQKYSIEYFASDKWKIWNFISKGPQVAFTLFDKDQSILDWFRSKTEERNTFFYMCTRSLHSKFNTYRPMFDEEGNKKIF